MSGGSPFPTAGLMIGLMSGTSLDGVDAALVEFTPAGQPRLLHSHYLPYPDTLRAELLELHRPGHNELQRSQQLSRQVTLLYAEAVGQLLQQAGMDASGIHAIASHGQTVRHEPQQGYSLQLQQPALLAELSGIAVISDFRNRDIAAGGQGAPLVPAFHAAQFSAAHCGRAILNVGGIANFTLLPRQGHVGGFDTGPGNVLLDAWIKLHQNLNHDANGHWASTAQADPELLQQLLAHPYFDQPPPKSCGREQFNLAWLDALLRSQTRYAKLAAATIQASLLELSAHSITHALQRWSQDCEEIYVCGGGAHNGALLQRLQTLLAPCRLATTEALGLSPDWVEAVAFAWLGWQTLHNRPGNLPAVTGARGPRILGAIHPA